MPIFFKYPIFFGTRACFHDANVTTDVTRIETRSARAGLRPGATCGKIVVRP